MSLTKSFALLLVTATLGSGAANFPTVSADKDRIVLQTDALALTLSKARNGAISSMVDARTERELAVDDPESRLFRLVFTRSGEISGETVTIDSTEATKVIYETTSGKDAANAVLLFSGLGGKRIEARCTATASDDSLIRWNISVTCAEALVLEEIQFPIVVLAERLGETTADDAFLAGATQHGKFLAPGDWGLGKRYTYTQPGHLAAQFACYYDPDGGCYMATQDGKGYPKRFKVERLAAGLGFTWSHLMYHEGTTPFVLPYPVALGTFHSRDKASATDWRDAADLYKAWAVKQKWCAKTIVQRTDVPDWIRHGCIRVQWNLRSDGKPGVAADWVDQHWSKHFGSLPPFMTFFGFEHIADWIAPNYFPFYPSDEAFRDASRRIMDRKGHIFLFPSSYHWARAYKKQRDGSFKWDGRADFEARGLAHTACNRDGSPVCHANSWLGGGDNAALCRGDAWSRQFLSDIYVQLLDRGVDMLQMDQVCGGGWATCFSRDHGHPPGNGLWDVEAYHEQMKDLRQRCDKIRPDVVFSQENPQELFIQDFGLYDYRHARANVNVQLRDTAPREHAPVFPYLYNEFVPVFYIPTHSEPVATILAHAIASGEIPSIKPRQIEFPGMPAISNGDFETWSKTPAGWNVWRSDSNAKNEIREAPGAPNSAGNAAWLENGKGDGTISLWQCIPVDGCGLTVGENCRLRLRLASADMAGTASAGVTALTSPNWWEWKTLDAWSTKLQPNTAWQDRTIPFTIPPNCKTLRIGMQLTKQGKVAFDDFVLERVDADGKTTEVQRPGNAVFKMLRQWAQWIDRGAGKYVMLGTMLHPPTLQTAPTQVTISANKSSALKFQYYTLREDRGRFIGTGGGSSPLKKAAGEPSWEHKTFDVTIAPGTTQFHIPMILRQKGELIFDDFELTEVGGTENLVRNPGFEDWKDAASTPPGWTHIAEYGGRKFTGSFHCETKDVHSGQHAIRLLNDTLEPDEEIHVKQVLPVDGTRIVVGKTYRLGVWVKVRAISRGQTVRVKKTYPAILHNAFRAPDGNEAVLMINITGQPQQGQLTWQGRQTRVAMKPWELQFLESSAVKANPEE